MKDLLNTFKVSIIGQIIGIICSFIAFYLPYSNDYWLKNGLFIFGMGLLFGYWLYLYFKVYKPLKDKE